MLPDCTLITVSKYKLISFVLQQLIKSLNDSSVFLDYFVVNVSCCSCISTLISALGPQM